MENNERPVSDAQETAGSWDEYLRQQVQVAIDQADRGELIDHATVFRHLRSLVGASREGE